MTERDARGNPDVRFEKTDVNAASLLKFGFWLVVATVAVVLLLWRLYFVFVAEEAARQPPPPVMRPDPAQMAPPAPRLQAHPAQELAEFRRREDLILGSYGWVDKEEKIVRIPIQEAMRIVAERGLPRFPAVPAAPGPAPGSPEPAPAAPRAQPAKPSPGGGRP